jgi:hypothetical protein
MSRQNVRTRCDRERPVSDLRSILPVSRGRSPIRLKSNSPTDHTSSHWQTRTFNFTSRNRFGAVAGEPFRIAAYVAFFVAAVLRMTIASIP